MAIYPSRARSVDCGATPPSSLQKCGLGAGHEEVGSRLLASTTSQGASAAQVGEDHGFGGSEPLSFAFAETLCITHFQACSQRFCIVQKFDPPYPPLTANSLGRITKDILAQLGIPITVFGPHSTRGAAVKMYKALGLSSEQVCELGQWKNPTAFTAHYLRLGAADSAASLLNPHLVHTVSSSDQVDPEWSHSPGTFGDPGRWDHEGDTQEEDEPTPPTQIKKQRGRKPKAIRKASDNDYKTFTFKKPTAGTSQH